MPIYFYSQMKEKNCKGEMPDKDKLYSRIFPLICIVGIGDLDCQTLLPAHLIQHSYITGHFVLFYL